MAFITIALIILPALISGAAVYALNRKQVYVFWAFLASFLIDSPYILKIFGVKNIDGILLISHTIGIIVFPIILIVLDIILIELKVLKHIRVFWSVLPKYMRNAIILEKFIERLQKYHAIPRPARVQNVYMVGIVAGIINLLFYLFQFFI